MSYTEIWTSFDYSQDTTQPLKDVKSLILQCIHTSLAFDVIVGRTSSARNLLPLQVGLQADIIITVNKSAADVVHYVVFVHWWHANF